MSRKALEWAWGAKLPYIEKFLLVALSLYADGQGECCPTVNELMQKTCLSKAAVFKAISTLEKLGIVTRSKHKKRGEKGQSNCYQLHTEKEVEDVSIGDSLYWRQSLLETKDVSIGDSTPLYSITRIVTLSLNKNLATALVFSCFVQILDSKKIPAAAAFFSDQDFKLASPIAKAPKIPPCPYPQIVELYRKWLPMCPAVWALSETRKKYIQARWREYPDLESFENFFQACSKSRFLTGQVSARGDRKPFVASLDWLMRPENFLKVLERKYHG